MKKLLILTVFALGCASNKEVKQEEGIHHLLYIGDNLARKSVTIKDYDPPKEIN
jgi:hypothetical protein